MQSTYFPNRFASKSSAEGKQGFSIHAGARASRYVNNAVFRRADAARNEDSRIQITVCRTCQWRRYNRSTGSPLSSPFLTRDAFLTLPTSTGEAGKEVIGASIR